MKKIRRTSNFKDAITQYTMNNSKEYILIILIFIIGIFIGVMFINNCTGEQENKITTYIEEFIEKFQNIEKINKTELMISTIKNNILLSIVVWLAGTTIIGMPVVLGIIFIRGFSLGYTISAISFTVGAKGRNIILFYGNILTKYSIYTSIINYGSKQYKVV